MDRLPDKVIEQDHKLEQTAESAARALIQLRWHWTADESNAQRVSVREYASAVGRKEADIRRDAVAYGLMTGAQGVVRSPNEARERANMTTETQAATEVVAKAYNLSFGQTRKMHGHEARRIRDVARQVAEERGTSTVDEIPQVAARTYQSREADRRTRDDRRQRRTFRYLEVEGSLTKARQNLLAAVRASEGVDFDGEERELLRDTLDNVSRLLALLDRAIAGTYDTSWKDELRVLEGGKAS